MAEKFKPLKRHLAASYGMSADDYREKLPADYPMVAPNYSTARSSLAKSMGLGRKPGTRLPTKDLTRITVLSIGVV